MRSIALTVTAVVIALLFYPSPARPQVTIGGFVGAYNRGGGSHPSVYLAAGGRAGIHLAGPLSAEIEALFVPAQVDNRIVDLFAYRLLSLWEVGSDEIRPFLVAGLGWRQWREWVCGGKSCADPEGPGQKFSYEKGVDLSVGGGVRLHTKGPVWFRIDGRFEKSLFKKAPTNNDPTLTLGMEISI